MTVADVGEFGLIAAMTAGLPAGARTLLGIGDDAAVLAAPDQRVVATMDLLIEGRHFRRDWSSASDVGRKAAARNLADIAAMGARPTGLLVGLAVPGELPARWARELLAGIAAEAAGPGAAVIGGDVSSADSVLIAVTALGELAGAAPVTRAGARPGDVLAVAGALGRAAAGLALLEAGLAGPPRLVAAQRRPSPPYRAGPQAAAAGATAMIDVSDGLVADARHLARASGLAVDIDTSLLRVPPELREASAALGGTDPLEWTLTGGEDHALLAAFPAGAPLPGGWAAVGRALAGQGVRVDGRPVPEGGGWEHFRRQI